MKKSELEKVVSEPIGACGWWVGVRKAVRERPWIDFETRSGTPESCLVLMERENRELGRYAEINPFVAIVKIRISVEAASAIDVGGEFAG